MKKLALVSLATLTTTIASSLSLADQNSIDHIEAAAQTLDIKTLEQLQQDNSGYDKALAHYRLAISYNVRGQQEKAESSLTQAIEALNALIKADGNNAEAHILLAQSYGLKIGFNPIKGAFYGPKVGANLQKAKTLDGDNPRLFLVNGVSDYNTPAMFGGSKQAAIKNLDQAIGHYANDIESGYHWGLAEAYVWRGLSNLELNRKGKAMADWGKALELAPNYGWPKMLINKNK